MQRSPAGFDAQGCSDGIVRFGGVVGGTCAPTSVSTAAIRGKWSSIKHLRANPTQPRVTAIQRSGRRGSTRQGGGLIVPRNHLIAMGQGGRFRQGVTRVRDVAP